MLVNLSNQIERERKNNDNSDKRVRFPFSMKTHRRTNADAAADREREWMNEAQTTQARLKKQAKLIEKMQLQAGALLFDET